MSLPALGADDRARLRTFAAWFVAERARVARHAVDGLIDSALTVSGYDLTMLAMPGGVRRMANARKLMRLAREHETVNGPGLHGFVLSLAQRAAGGQGTREGEAPVEGEGLDAIRVMTIHRAKGLEFHTVVVADLGRSVRPRSEIVRVSGDGRGSGCGCCAPASATVSRHSSTRRSAARRSPPRTARNGACSTWR